jgi:hypothetical protein
VEVVVRDPQARRLMTALEADLTPVVFEIDRGYITGKGIPRGIDDVVALVNARAHSDAAEIPDHAIRLRTELPLEVYGARN